MEIENTSVSENEVIEEEVTGNEENEQEETIEEPVEETVTDSPEDILGDEESEENIVDDAETVPGIEDSDTSSAIVEDTETVSDSDIGVDVSAHEDPDAESVTGGDVYYITTVPEDVPFWEKHFSEYTVSDGVLVVALIIFTFVFLWFAIKEKG